MAKLPRLTGQELGKVLEKAGFEKVRQKGSHAFFRHPDGRTTVVPMHAGEIIDRGLLDKIIKKDAGLSRDEFMKLL
jgi:predicted RNA binding protein YcfA (HicA-like mRNA interferase family)